MVLLYYVLARDEERRMLGQFGEDYRQYMDRTGMFVSKPLEDTALKLVPASGAARAAVVIGILAVLSVGGAFAARAYTVRSLPLWSNGAVTALVILPNDLGALDHRMTSVLGLPEIKTRLDGKRGPFLVYVMPQNYVMQGMIADTGGEWQLYKRHHTLAMISDWILHPFGHLEGESTMMQPRMARRTRRPSSGSTLGEPRSSWPMWRSMRWACRRFETFPSRRAGGGSPRRASEGLTQLFPRSPPL
jgi:hypothetical protein